MKWPDEVTAAVVDIGALAYAKYCISTFLEEINSPPENARECPLEKTQVKVWQMHLISINSIPLRTFNFN